MSSRHLGTLYSSCHVCQYLHSRQYSLESVHSLIQALNSSAARQRLEYSASHRGSVLLEEVFSASQSQQET